MNKISEFLIKRRNLILIIVTIFTIYSITLISKVNVISDMTKLLPDDSQMKIGIDIMEDEFSNLEEDTVIKVMSTNLDNEKKLELIEKLEKLNTVTSVDYKEDSEDYNKDNYSLFIVNTDVSYDSNKFTTLLEQIETNLVDDYNLIIASGEEASPSIPIFVMFIAVAVIMIILFLMCGSWIEPFLFMASIGIAVVINMGTNAYFDWVSETTFSIVAMLQLVLSMDYSIILANRYSQELKLGKTPELAMKDAIKGSFGSIAGSSLTTVVGLAALVFMRFKIGPDMGLVLGKGVLISMIVILTVLPGFILFFNKAIIKTKKKILNIPMNKISNFSFKNKKIISGFFVVFFIAVFILKNNMGISFLMFEYNEIEEIFPTTNSIVILYDNSDEQSIKKIASNLEKDSNIKNVMTYSTIFGKDNTSTQMYEFIMEQENSSEVVVDQTSINFLYYDYYKSTEYRTMTLSNFTEFLNNYATNHTDLVSTEDIAQFSALSTFTSKEQLTKERTSLELATIFNIDEQMVNQLLAMSGKNLISIVDFVSMIQITPAILTSLNSLNPNALASLTGLSQIINSTMNDVEFTAGDLTNLFKVMSSESSFDESSINLIYEMYYSTINYDETWVLTIEQLFEHITKMANNEAYVNVFDDSIKEDITSFSSELEDGKNQLVSENYSLMIIETKLPAESDETNKQYAKLVDTFEENLTKNYYLVGNTPMQYELTNTFSDELTKITILTALAIFIVVMITFKSTIIPLILILLIQSAVYATMVIYSINGSSLNFMALLIVQSILMGATTDYAILFTSYYREKRKLISSKEALLEAYNHSIHTIFTSGLIMVLVTFIVSFAFTDPAIAQICRTISLGATCAIILILFVLPSQIAYFDKFISKIKK